MPGSTNSAASSGASKWEPPSVERLQEMLPQYEITALIGRGGMGAVYKGVQTTLDRTVAIKLLPESLQEDAGDGSFVERFKLEARSMASLDHPAIISVFDFGQTSEGHLYFVMEFIDGMDLQQYLNASGGKLEVEAAVAIISHVLDALEYAHKKGIVHRDIKPANVLINSEGRVKIADFGLAKEIGGEVSGLTMSNVAMGTPDFIAPEAMLDSASSDGRADLYAVGVMLYQMLTGRLPRGMFKLPSEEDASFDPRFDDIIASALEPNPEYRFSAAKDFRKKLDELRTQPVSKIEGRSTIERRGAKTQDVTPAVKRGLPARPAQRKSGNGLLWTAATVALLGTVAWLVLGGRQDTALPSEMPPAEFWKGEPETVKKGEPAIEAKGQTTEAVAGEIPSSSPRREPERSEVPGTTVRHPLATKETPFSNFLGMKFVPVPGTDVFFCIHETRYKDYAAYAADSTGVDKKWEDQTLDGFELSERHEEHPVVRISWDDATKFCEWLSGKEGKTYRLPTDEEWSIAVGLGDVERRTGGTTPAMLTQKETLQFPWGDAFPPTRRLPGGNYSDESRRRKAPQREAEYLDDYDDGFPTTAPVMSFGPNRFGLYDMGGNVWEWCDDWYDDAQMSRVLRGGCWRNWERRDLLSSTRSLSRSDRRHVLHGFRVVLEARSAVAAAPVPGTTTTSRIKPRIDDLVANGEWQDVFPLLASDKAKSNGKWTFGPTGLEGVAIGSRASIGLPTQSLVQYEAQIQITANKCKSIGFLLPTPQGAMSLIAHVESDQIVLADGSNMELNPSTQSATVKAIDGEIHEFLVRVSSAEVTLFLDGIELYRYRPQDWGEVTQMAGNSFPLTDTPTLGLRLQEANVLFQSFRIRIPDASPPKAQSVSAVAKAVEKIEGVQSRIANFQKARHQQLGDLTGKYQKALASSKNEASKVGDAAHEMAIQMAMTRAANFAAEIEKLPATKTVASLSALPALDVATPESLKKLRGIFDRESAKIEKDLLGKLDQSLEAFQTSMLEAGDLEVVDALRAYRKAIARPEVVGKTGAVGLGAPRLVSVDQIWNNAPHNGYTDLLFYSGKWFCVFREGSRATSIDGSLRVITPDDEGRWATLAQFTSAGEDLRDPTVSVTPDGRLMISCRAIGRGSKPTTKVWFSEDAGTTWSEGTPIGKVGFWVWRPQWNQEFCYSISYEVNGACTATLCRSGDGLNFVPISAPRRIGAQYGEDTILFLPDQSALCLFRNFDGDQTTGLGTAQPPYKEWDWKPLNQQVAGPNMIQLQDGRVIVATRLSDGETRTSLAWLDPGKSTLAECLRLPSGGSTGYAGLAWKDDLLWVSYYSSHEGKASVYLAKVAFDATSSPQQTHENAGATKATGGPSASTTTEPFENSLGMKFVPVPIQGGSTDGQALLFSVWETRVQDYEVFVKQTKRKWPKPDFPQGPDHPAVMVSWEDATAFCDWLTQRERQAGTIGTDQVYRLPSDHEWSCAAGIAGGENAADTPERKLAGVSKLYPWGRDWPPPNGSGNYNGQETLRNPFDGTPMGGYNDGFDRTAPVGSFAPTTSGLYDLGGNVVEWCSDRWDGKASTAKTVLRGGSWRDGQERFHLSSFRFGMPANQSDDRAGFRCVLAPIGGATASNEDGWIDLIAAVDPVKDVSTRNNWRADQNLWEKQGSALVFLESNSSGEILLPNTENITDFEIRMAMTRESGTRGIDFKIPTPGGATPIIIGGNTGSQLKGNPRPLNFVSHPLTTGQKMEVVITVRSTGTNAGIKVEADGKPIIDWKGVYRSELGVIDNYQSKRIGLWIGLPPKSNPVSKFRFHEILFRRL